MIEIADLILKARHEKSVLGGQAIESDAIIMKGVNCC
jgi:hypothetical protein